MNGRKIFTIICIMAIVISIVLGIWLHFKEPHKEFRITSEKAQEFELGDLNAKKVKDIELKGAWGFDLDVINGKKFKVDVIAPDNVMKKGLKENIKISLKKGKLSVDTSVFDNNLRKKLYNKRNRKPEKVIKISVPGNVELSTVYIKSKCGDVHLNGIKSNYLSANLGAGNFMLKKVKAEILIGRVSAGDIVFEGKTKQLDITDTSGNVAVDLFNLPKKINTNINAGNLNIIVRKSEVKQPLKIGYKINAGEMFMVKPPDMISMFNLEKWRDSKKVKKNIDWKFVINAGDMTVKYK